MRRQLVDANVYDCCEIQYFCWIGSPSLSDLRGSTFVSTVGSMVLLLEKQNAI